MSVFDEGLELIRIRGDLRERLVGLGGREVTAHELRQINLAAEIILELDRPLSMVGAADWQRLHKLSCGSLVLEIEIA